MNLKRSTSTIEAAEKKEKRVLIQMSVLVVAFLLFWLPFWVYLMTMHICLVVYDEVRTSRTHFQTLFSYIILILNSEIIWSWIENLKHITWKRWRINYQQAHRNIRGRLGFVHTIFWQLPQPYSNQGADYALNIGMSQPTFRLFHRAWIQIPQTLLPNRVVKLDLQQGPQ